MDNSFSGGTNVEAGLLEISSGGALGSGVTTISGGELRAIAGLTLDNEMTIAGDATLSVVTGQTLTIASALTVDNGASLTLGSEGNGGEVVFSATAVNIQGSNTQIAVQTGTLVAGNDQLATFTAGAGATVVAAGATLDFQDLTGNGINALYGAGTVNTGTSSSTTLTVNSGNFSGNISGAGALVKETDGTLVLSGQNAFIGGTTVNAGTLVVDGNLSFGLGNVQLNGGTLGGSGSVGTIFLNGGELAPGSAGGSTLTAQNLYWISGTLVFDLGATSETSDHLSIGGLQGFGTMYAFSFKNEGWVEGETYTLITFLESDIDINDFYYTNAGGFAGVFSYNAEGTMLQFTITATPIPEPEIAGVLIGILSGTLLLFRRRSVRGRNL